MRPVEAALSVQNLAGTDQRFGFELPLAELDRDVVGVAKSA
ncbi:hypothetical protein [Amycolatopsis sp. CA-128772]|nr:hypothetical protein [Amycolatopsis sp. CA-128772]